MTASDLGAAVARAAALLADQPRAAGREAQALLQRAPDDPRLRLILASALRRLDDPAGALAVLQPLARAYPNAARTQYELGLALLATGQGSAGKAALRRAVQIMPTLIEAWQALGDHLFREGDLAGASRAFAELERHAVVNPALRDAADAVFAGDSERAEALLVRHLHAAPDDAEALRMLGEVRLKRGQLAEAEVLLDHGLRLDPAHDGARFSLALTRFRRQAGEPALATLQPLLAKAPRDAAYRNLHAAVLALIGRHDEALGIYADLLREFAQNPHIWLNYGQALRTVGRRDEAIAAFRRAIALAPGLGEAYWSLANLKTVRLTPDEVAAMQAQLGSAAISEDDRLHLHYALGKTFEDAADYARSFEHYAAGARIRHAQRPFDPDRELLTDRIKAVCTPALFAGAPSQCRSDAPIFVLGLPRSGSTLVEQILASHSAVEGTMELPDIAALAEATGSFPESLAGLTAADCTALGQAYLDRTAVHRSAGRPRFVDKMPNNFRYIGLIARILPQATIIDVRRHPMAACFAGFKQHFAAGHAWSYDLGMLGRYYRDYVDLMRHFDAVLPGRIHRVIYEDLVDETEPVIRALLEHCRLPFEPGCLEFHRTERAVRTVSSEQVRRPIFREGLDQWRHYQPWLNQLAEALGEVINTWRT